jgi:hypothetical protein
LSYKCGSYHYRKGYDKRVAECLSHRLKKIPIIGGCPEHPAVPEAVAAQVGRLTTEDWVASLEASNYDIRLYEIERLYRVLESHGYPVSTEEKSKLQACQRALAIRLPKRDTEGWDN